MKVTSRDIIAILRRFEFADDTSVPRLIDQLKISHPLPHNTLVSFRFNKQLFYVLFDDTAEDDASYILQQIQTDKQDITGEVVENPNDHITTYALPFKGKDVYLFAAVSQKKRLDAHLAELYPETSRSTWQKHIKLGRVSVNGVMRESPKYEVQSTDSISIVLPDATDFSQHALPILYLDDNVIVVNKPVGVLTHSKGALNDEFTVAEFFRRYTTFGLETNRPGIVHRLDRDTSGVIIGARTPEAASLLQKQFSERTVKKAYIAILHGLLKEKRAAIDLPIGRNPSTPSTFRVDPKGKSAQTNYRVLEESQNLSLIELQPLTGRTHQLRVHMHYLKAPIEGDRVYGKSSSRLYLHAYSLEITIPGGERKTFIAPLPDDFKKLFPGVELP